MYKLGANYYFKILLGEIRRGGKGPAAVKSEFGWLISGSDQASGTESNEIVTNLMSERPEHTNWPLHRRRRRWTNECCSKSLEYKVNYRIESRNRTRVSARRNLLKRANEIKLVYRGRREDPKLPVVIYLVSADLRQSHSRLKRTPELLKEYSNVIKQQQELGINRANRRRTRKQRVCALFTPSRCWTSRKAYYERLWFSSSYSTSYTES